MCLNWYVKDGDLSFQKIHVEFFLLASTDVIKKKIKI